MSSNESLTGPHAMSWPTWALAVAALLIITGAIAALEGAPPSGVFGPGGAPSTLCSGSATSLAVVSATGTLHPASGSGPPGGPQPAFPLGLSQASNLSVGAAHCYAYPISTVGAGFTIGQVGIEITSSSCAPDRGMIAIMFTDGHGSAIASEDLTTHTWGSAGAVAPVVGDYVVLVATHTLIGDALILRASGGSTSSLIAGSGFGTGCSF
jgi:hypothetical protein